MISILVLSICLSERMNAVQKPSHTLNGTVVLSSSGGVGSYPEDAILVFLVTIDILYCRLCFTDAT